ncbi:MAG: hypothetical protein AB2L14_18030 [Candidatus Xenobiia bacterium LiM19]
MLPDFRVESAYHPTSSNFNIWEQEKSTSPAGSEIVKYRSATLVMVSSISYDSHFPAAKRAAAEGSCKMGIRWN